MSDALLKALLESQYSAKTDAFGVGAQALGAAAPLLYNPYGSAGSNAGIAIGAGLLSGLLGGFANRRADARNAELYSQLNQMTALPMASRQALIEQNPRLASYGLALKAQEDAAAREMASKREELSLKSEFDRAAKIQDALLAGGYVPGEDNMPVLIPQLDPVEAKKREFEALIPLKVDEARQTEDAKRQAEADALGYNPRRLEAETALRKEFSGLPEVKTYSQVEKAAGIISSALQDDSKVSDQELVRYSILLIEPGLAVREGEAAAIQNSQAFDDALKGQLQGALDGKTTLGPQAREGIKRLAMRAFEGHRTQYDEVLRFYQGRAKNQGLDPSAISYIGEPQVAESVFGALTQPSGLNTLSDEDLDRLILQKGGGQ